MRSVWHYMIVLIFIIILAGCGASEPTSTEPDDEETVEDSMQESGPEEVEEEEDVVFPYTAPLTGLGSMTELDQRIVAVMINNHSKARPQTGLGEADMVYEVLSEGYITRLIALYHSQSPEVIGPVRSLRPYFIDIVNGYDAIFAHAGGSTEALSIVRQRHLPSLDEIYNSERSFYRVDFRKAPHNLYTNLDLLREGAEYRGFREDSEIPGLLFKEPEEEMEGTSADEIDILYADSYSVSYHYDEETELYTRHVQGTPHLDRETEEPLTMTNVFVIETSHRILDNEGRRAVDVMSEGKGLLFQKGKVIECEWRRVDGVIRPFVDGREIGLYPGKTWVNIVPNSPGLDHYVNDNREDTSSTDHE
nr:DUF3048 domain-containing protein [Caldalkalibacillus salinus]